MSRSRYAVLPLVLGLLAGTACYLDDLSGVEVCLHSEGCPEFVQDPYLGFYGQVTSAATGELLQDVTVRIEAPARAWSDTVLTSVSGNYMMEGLRSPAAGDCAGLSVSFTRAGYQPLRVSDFPGLTCARGFWQVNRGLIPIP
jgi:hypothetical protein